MYSEPSLWQLALIATIILAATARTHLSSDETAIDEAKRLYSEGKIDEPELERRLGEEGVRRQEAESQLEDLIDEKEISEVGGGKLMIT